MSFAKDSRGSQRKDSDPDEPRLSDDQLPLPNTGNNHQAPGDKRARAAESSRNENTVPPAIQGESEDLLLQGTGWHPATASAKKGDGPMSQEEIRCLNRYFQCPTVALSTQWPEI